MKFTRINILVLVIALLLSACVQTDNSSAVTPPAKPQADKTTVIGRILDKKTGQPLPNRVLRLGEVIRKEGAPDEEGIFIMDASFSPGARSDSNGYFIFENIESKEYVLLLEVLVDANYAVAKGDNDKPFRWQPEVGKVLDLGNIYFGLEEPK